ncbi:MAG TPA: sigma-70 family RNA polymerase sigma factor [Candidatus Methylacidiphilales bacterium]
MSHGTAATPAWDEFASLLSALDGGRTRHLPRSLSRRRPHPLMDDAPDFSAEAAAQAELEALVLRARAGDTTAQETLIATYRRRLGGFVYGMLGDASHVDDLTQTVFVRIFLALDRLRDPARFEAWLFKAARNACLSHLRRERFRRLFSPLSDREEEIAASPTAAEAGPSDDLLLLRAALKTLPARDRALLLLVQDRETGYEHIAAEQGITVGALKTRVHRAKALLRTRIERMRHAQSQS